MDEFTRQLVEEFSFKAKSIRKSKYMYICRNDTQARILRPTNQEPDSISFSEAIKARLIKNGFSYIDKYYMSSQGTAYFHTDEKNYIMTDYLDYPESDFSTASSIRRIINATGTIHRAGRGYEGDFSKLYVRRKPVQELEEGIKRLKEIKKIVCSQKKYSDFDIVFIRNYEGYINDAQEAYEILLSSKIEELIDEGEKRRLFCHNALKEENILFAPNALYIIGFDSAYAGHYVFDLYQLIERYMRKGVGEHMPLDEITECYFNANERDERLYPVLFALLKFPFRFIKICNGFYNKKRSWVPNSTKEQLDAVLNMKKEGSQYISAIRNK